MRKRTWSLVSQMVSTVKKSVARIWLACWRTNWRHERCPRRGAGGRWWRRRTLRTVRWGAAEAESEEFALDAAVAPAWVLAGEAEDELVELGGSRALSA